MAEDTELDIYGDLLLDEALIHPLEKHIEQEKKEKRLKHENERKFNEDFEELKIERDNLKKSNVQLQINMQTLLVTVRNETARKDKIIAELRRELDNFKFRRTKVSSNTSSSYTQTDPVPLSIPSADVPKSNDTTTHRPSTSDRRNKSRDRERSDGRRYEKSSSQDKPSYKRDYEGRSSREERPKHSSYRTKEGERSKEYRKRSRSPRSRHDQPQNEKRQKVDEINHKKRRSEKSPDLLRSLLVKQASNSAKDDSEKSKPKRESPRKKNMLAVEIAEVVSIKSSDSEIELTKQDLEKTVLDKSPFRDIIAETEMSEQRSDQDILQSQKKKIEEELASLNEAPRDVELECDSVGEDVNLITEDKTTEKKSKVNDDIVVKSKEVKPNETVKDKIQKSKESESKKVKRQETIVKSKDVDSSSDAKSTKESTKSKIRKSKEKETTKSAKTKEQPIEVKSITKSTEPLISNESSQAPSADPKPKDQSNVDFVIEPQVVKIALTNGISQILPEFTHQEAKSETTTDICESKESPSSDLAKLDSPKIDSESIEANVQIQTIEVPQEFNESLNSSSASKENSLNHSQGNIKKSKTKTTYEKEVEADGSVVFTITRNKKKKKKNECS